MRVRQPLNADMYECSKQKPKRNRKKSHCTFTQRDNKLNVMAKRTKKTSKHKHKHKQLRCSSFCCPLFAGHVFPMVFASTALPFKNSPTWAQGKNKLFTRKSHLALQLERLFDFYTPILSYSFIRFLLGVSNFVAFFVFYIFFISSNRIDVVPVVNL